MFECSMEELSGEHMSGAEVERPTTQQPRIKKMEDSDVL